MDSLVVSLEAPDAGDAKRFGPKAANLALLGRAGLPVPGGYAVDARAYRAQLASLGLEATAREVFAAADRPRARRCALDMKLGLMENPVAPEVKEPLVSAWRQVTDSGARGVVRSSALVEDRADSSFAGQFESYLELQDEEEFLLAVRACWAALWSTRALRYMATHGLDPADTAMALIVQPLVAARVSGGGLSRTADDAMVINAAPGHGSAIAQGEIAPDRYVLDREGAPKESAPGRKYHGVTCVHGRKALSRSLSGAPCLDGEQLAELGLLLRKSENVMGGPVEIEWAADEAGIKLLQARPLRVAPVQVRGDLWVQHPRLDGHPSGIGWGEGRARVVNCECELERVAPGDVLVTTVAGPALGPVLAHVAGVVAELGGSTSHLASLARERGVPMVLGVPDATRHIPDGATVAVDGVAGVVRWMQ
ncbi:MAG TPA: PEP/pyruvate-binding domain-containing protein [Burkholderiales bacterium]|nr:PEP/pyruvate-binding domain-containing protein [Burkholderiales bacterium]